MTGATHRQYSVTFAFISAMILYTYNLSEINYFLSLIIILPMSQAGAMFPDKDHNWDLVRDKTVPSWIINKLIHLTGGKHRSWQTHSIDIVAVVTFLSFYLPKFLSVKGIISEVDSQVLSIITVGFSSGWVSHMISDMLTSAGVRLVCWNSYKVKFVPKKIGKFRFNTGNEWEAFNYKVIKFCNGVLGFICILYPFLSKGNGIWMNINQLVNMIG